MYIEFILILFFSVVCHECAHGWVAYKLGDPTAKNLGRLTLNPIKHIDLVGTIILPVILILSNSGIVLGWAKPVPVNFSNLRHPKRDVMWVGLSGPAVNVLLAIIFSLFLKINLSSYFYELVSAGIVINLILAVFNLIPVPPLDGSRFVIGLLPGKYARYYAQLEPYGIIIIFALLYFGLLKRYVLPAALFLSKLLGVE